MAGMVLRKTGVVLLTILKWILQIALMALKLVLGMTKLFLLLLALVMRIILTMAGVRQADGKRSLCAGIEGRW